MERHEHIVSAYEQDLSSLNNKIAKMGGLAELVVGQSLEALEKRDKALAESTIEQDEAIDRLEAEIEHDVGVIIFKRQPVAYDLRQVMAPFRIAIDLERIGDLGKNIAKRTLATGSEAPPGRLMLDLKHMGQLALVQLKEVLVAFMERDADHALKVWYKDESIDTTFNTVFRKLITYMMENPKNIELCTHLLFGAKNLERTGDHTTNIAETVYFLVHGTTINDQRPKADTTNISLVANRGL